MQISVVYCATANHLIYASISAASALRRANLNDHYTFYILSESFTPDTQRLFIRLNRIKNSTYIFFKIPEESINELKNYHADNVGMLYRLCIPDIVKREDKVIYLDTDTIVHSDLRYLFERDISDYYVAAVEDKEDHIMRKFIRLKKNQVFFNCGVLLMNLKAFREHKLSKRILTNLKNSRHQSYRHSINTICKDRTLYLPLPYNISTYPQEISYKPDLYKGKYDDYYDAISFPVIHHIILNPWDGDNINFSTSFEWRRTVEYLEKLERIFSGNYKN